MNNFETDRLILRHIVETDVEDIFEYCKTPNVGPNAGWELHKTLDDSKVILKEVFLNQPNIFGMVLKETQKMIGTIGLIDDPRRQNPNVLMLAYAMSETYWGKGLMTEAALAVIKHGFDELPIDIITCSCYTTNSRSRRLIEKCGFRYEGCLQQAELRFDGKIMDMECFSLERETDYKLRK